MNVVLLVTGIVALVALILAALVIFLVRRRDAMRERLSAELSTEPPLRGPESAVFRGGTGAYPRVVGNGIIALTKRRLIFRIIVGKGVDIPLEEIAGIRTARTFRRSVVGGKWHLIVATASGEVGFFVTDTDAWIAAITDAAPALRG